MPDEKNDEKDAEKREEKAPGEKSVEEKYRRDPLGAIVWAGILIWAGLVLLASNLNILQFQPITGLPTAVSPGPWGVIFLGAGVILVLEVLVRLLVPDYRRPISGTLFLAVIFIGIGFGNIFGFDVVWPFILIGIGLSILVRGFMRQR